MDTPTTPGSDAGPDMDGLDDRLELAIDVASAAGRIIAARYEEAFEIETKSSVIDLVTEVDRMAEARIIEAIQAAFPHDGILAEESGAHDGDDGAPRWIIDPLDGTTNFAHGFPYFSVSVAVASGDVVQAGVVHDPIRSESFCAARGRGAWVLGPAGRRPIGVTQVDALERSLVATGFPYDRATSQRRNLDEFSRVIGKVRGVRRGGSAALDLANVAAGRLDGYWELGLSPWDWAAGWCLVEEAGGRVGTIDDEAFRLGASSLCAAGPGLFEPLRRAVRGR